MFNKSALRQTVAETATPRPWQYQMHRTLRANTGSPQRPIGATVADARNLPLQHAASRCSALNVTKNSNDIDKRAQSPKLVESRASQTHTTRLAPWTENYCIKQTVADARTVQLPKRRMLPISKHATRQRCSTSRVTTIPE